MKALLISHLPVIALAATGTAAEPLSRYTHVTTRLLDGISEASAVAYNPDRNTLFSIGDEGQAIFEFSKSGDLLGSMNITNPTGSNGMKALVDPEGLAYLGNGVFMIGDERPMTGLVTTYVAGTTVTASDFPVHLFDPAYVNNPNNGLEGVCFDPVNNSIWGVKELSPFAIYQLKDLNLPTQNVTKPFQAREFNKLGYLTDIADIFVMAGSSAFTPNDPRRMNILILSQQDNLILEMNRSGQVVDKLDISFVGRHTIEGITMDQDGVIYLVSEQPVGSTQSGLHILTPPPTATPFEAWAAAMGLEENTNGPEDDPDRDGSGNLNEYAFGTHPGQPDPMSGGPKILGTPEGYRWEFTRRSDDPGLSYTLQSSGKLDEWTSLNSGIDIHPDSERPGFSRISVTIPPGEIPLQRFFRVIVSYTQPNP